MNQNHILLATITVDGRLELHGKPLFYNSRQHFAAVDDLRRANVHHYVIELPCYLPFANPVLANERAEGPPVETTAMSPAGTNARQLPVSWETSRDEVVGHALSFLRNALVKFTVNDPQYAQIKGAIRELSTIHERPVAKDSAMHEKPMGLGRRLESDENPQVPRKPMLGDYIGEAMLTLEAAQKQYTNKQPEWWKIQTAKVALTSSPDDHKTALLTSALCAMQQASMMVAKDEAQRRMDDLMYRALALFKELPIAPSKAEPSPVLRSVTFDDKGIGYANSKAAGSNVGEMLIARPAGLLDAEWHPFASAVRNAINAARDGQL